MMSDFMFPIYIGNKQNSRTEERQRRDSTDTEEGTTEERPMVGQDKQERGKAK